MKKICFICHGNICRSPMAEFIMKEKINKLNLQDEFIIDSKATSKEELGNDIHPGTKRILKEHNVPYTNHYATQIKPSDYNNYDYFICMDQNNIRNLSYIFDDSKHKVIKLNNNDVADPWYTGDFTQTYQEINKGIDKLIKNIIK